MNVKSQMIWACKCPKIAKQPLRILFTTIFFFFTGLNFVFAKDDIYPDKPNPPMLVNDFAHCLANDEVNNLENKLEQFAKTTSTQITIVTINNLGGHDVEEYSVEVFNKWGIGQTGKNNGVLLLFSMEDRKGWITVGSGLEGVLTDAKSGVIFRNEIVPAFRENRYFDGLSHAADAIIAVTKGEYNADGTGNGNGFLGKGVIVFIIFIVIIIWVLRGRGGGGGGMYNRSGFSNLMTGLFLGNLLGGGWGNNDSNGGGGWGNSGGGFGGFGGGSSGGGGAGGSW